MVLTTGINAIDKTKSDQLFDAYIDFQADDTIKQKDFLNFQGYIKSKNLGFTQSQIGNVFEDLWNPDKKQEIIDSLKLKTPEINEKAIQAIQEKTKEHKIKMTEATNKADQEKTTKMEELTNLLQDKPENAEKNAEKIKDQVKTRLGQTIEKYVNKIKEFKNSSESEKKTKETELKAIKEELKRTKEEYEKAKKDFFSEVGSNFKDFSKEELKKLPIRLLRYKQREGLFNKPAWFNSVSSIRRRKTINTLAKKINEIWKDNTKWINFVIGFEKDRLWRYTFIKMSTAIHKLGANMWLQMNPQQFHERFNKGRSGITKILENPNAGELSSDEKTKVDAIKNRINYYGANYAKERANARVWPFLQAEKNATEKSKILQMNPANEVTKAA
jgi:hypothetical protein